MQEVGVLDDNLTSLKPGTIVAGRYEIERCLGSGSMGLVYSCRNRELSDHLVAVKVLFPEVAKDKIAAARFRNEIFASYGVSHPNVVRAYEYIRDGDLLAYTMEYVDGGDLADRLEQSELMGISEIVSVLKQMSLGVQAIHDAGIVHRDLKPENILLTKDAQVKIADFGIARTGTGQRLTEHGGVVGTIDYVSPEYMMNSQVDWRSDIYAIGVLAYEMVTGDLPFPGDSPYEVMTKRLQSDPVTPKKVRTECPGALADLILMSMHRDPLKRIQSAKELHEQLVRIEAGQALSDNLQPIGTGNEDTYVGPTLVDRVVESVSADADTLVQGFDWDDGRGILEQHGVEVNLDGTTQIIPIDAIPELERVAEIRLQKTESVDLGNYEDDQSELERQTLRMKQLAIGADHSSSTSEHQSSEPVLQAHTNYGIWLDILTIFVAIVLGLVLGLLLLKSVWPDFLADYYSFFEVNS